MSRRFFDCTKEMPWKSKFVNDTPQHAFSGRLDRWFACADVADLHGKNRSESREPSRRNPIH
jgi:hypothetical protein